MFTSNCVTVLMTILGGGGGTPLYGRWSGGGPGRAVAELAKGEPVLSPVLLVVARAASRRHFQFVQSPCWNADPLGVFLAGCCWQLLVPPQISLGHCRPFLACVPLTHLPTGSTRAPVLCELWFLPCTVRFGPSSGCRSESPLTCHGNQVGPAWESGLRQQAWG